MIGAPVCSRTPRRPPGTTHRALLLGARYAALALVASTFVFPFYWMIVTSLNDPTQVFETHPYLLPRWHFENYAQLFSGSLGPKIPWGRYFVNTVLVASLTTFLVAATSALAGYAFAAINFRGRSILFLVLLAIYIIPAEVTLVPNFITIKTLHWLDTYQAQIVPFGASVFGIFLLRQFFLTLPNDLWEAAQLDGCGRARFLWSIALPLARPALVTVSLFTFIAAWNAFLWPLIVTNLKEYRPLQVGLLTFANGSDAGTQPTLIAAAAFMTTMPVMLIFFLAQRQLVGGIASTGIRG